MKPFYKIEQNGMWWVVLGPNREMAEFFRKEIDALAWVKTMHEHQARSLAALNGRIPKWAQI